MQQANDAGAGSPHVVRIAGVADPREIGLIVVGAGHRRFCTPGLRAQTLPPWHGAALRRGFPTPERVPMTWSSQLDLRSKLNDPVARDVEELGRIRLVAMHPVVESAKQRIQALSAVPRPHHRHA